MRMEMGSEFAFSLDEFKKKKHNLWEYLREYEIQKYDSGRSAIKSISYDKEKVVLLPEYICESVIKSFKKRKIVFYHIDDKFDIDETDLLSKLDVRVGLVYICHYFGFLQKDALMKKIRDKALQVNALLLEDMTQSFFSKMTLVGDLGILSIRKWLPVSQGGILYTGNRNLLDENIYSTLCTSSHDERALGMFLKKIYLDGELDTNRIYRKIFEQYEQMLDEQNTIERMSELAELQIQCIDIPAIREKRKRNAKYLANALKNLNIDEIRTFSETECPFAFPLRVNNRDDFRNYLIENHIYCAVHWPVDEFMGDDRKQAMKNAQQLISLPIDQRYGEKEMDYLIDIINKYRGDLKF